MWAPMSDAELLQRSELIVIGTLQGPTTAPAPAVPGAVVPHVGALAVSEVLKGPAATARVLLAMPAPGALRSSSDIVHRVGDHGLWLLRRHPGGAADVYLADHPQRFVSMATEAARIEALRKLLRPR